MPNKYHAYLLNVEPSNFVFLKTNNTEFNETIIIFTDQNCGPLEIEDKVNLTFLINKWKWQRFSSLVMWRYATEARTRKYVKRYGFLSFARK